MALTLAAGRSHLLVIDVQDRLAPVVDGVDGVVATVRFLAEVAGLCAVPTLITEQYPKGLGHTVSDVLSSSAKPQVVEKTAFSAARESKVMIRLRKKRDEQRRDQIVITGMEAHICVLQTALELQEQGYTVFVVADGVSSRHIGSRDIALSRLAHAGVTPVTSEMVAFEWVGDAKAKMFKQVSSLVRHR
ncbi:MAG: isochorismatase family protein [Pseudomonadota bacterium]